MQKDSLIYVAGHRGTAGSAIVEELNEQGFINKNRCYFVKQNLNF